MTKSTFIVSSFVVAMCVSGIAQAGYEPCHMIREQCQAAGHNKAHDCVKHIVNGGSIEGVTVTPQVIQDCKAKRPDLINN